MPVGYGYNFGGMLGGRGVRPMGGISPGGGGSPSTGGAGWSPGPSFGVGAPPTGGYAAPPQLPPAPPWMPSGLVDNVNAARPPQASIGPVPWERPVIQPQPYPAYPSFTKPRSIKPPGGTTMGFDPYKPYGY